MNRRAGSVRILFLAAALAAIVLAGAGAWLAAGAAIGHLLADLLPPDRVEEAVRAVRGAVLWGGAAAAVPAAGLALLLARRVTRPLRRVRGRLADADAAAASDAADEPAEIAAVASAAGRLAKELTARVDSLARERDELVTVVEAVSEGIVQLDAGGRVVRANAAALALLGLPADARGRPVATLVRHAGLRRALESAARGGTTPPVELGLDDRRLLVAARALAGGPEGRAGAVAVVVDLTELRRLEGVRRDFVADASHELKTPLTSIRGYVETLLGDEPPPEISRQFLETIRYNAERLQRIVDDLLDLSRIESGSWRPEAEPVAVGDAAAEAWEGLRERAEAKGVAFSLPERDAFVLADRVALGQVFSNLFDNALRYTPAGGRIQVRLTAPVQEGARTATPRAAPPLPADPPAPAAGWVAVEVRDTGTGIPREALPRIFERFYRVDPARSRAEGGTGLGLSIVRHLVESMGGEVGAESELGKGTVIRFLLPAARGTPAPAGG